MKNFLKKTLIRILTLQAQFILKKYKPRIIAVTGSAGKTSAKDAITAVMEGFFSVRKSEKSYNSEIGIPLTVLGVPNQWGNIFGWLGNIAQGLITMCTNVRYPEWLVLEVGADKPNDIQKAMEWIHPDISVITAIGEVPVHVEYYDSPEAVFKEKCKLLHGLVKGGIGIVNADDALLKEVVVRDDVRLVTYGWRKGVDVHATHASVMSENNTLTGMCAKVKIGKSVFPIRVRGVLGNQQIYPALAGLAVAHVLDKNILMSLHALERKVPAPGRMRILEGTASSVIIDDTYNASPLSMSSALDALAQVPATRRIVLLGHMAELGTFSESEHTKLGEHAARVADLVLTSGSQSDGIADAVRRRKGTGMVVSFSGPEHAAQYVSAKIKAGDVILVKGSQSARMEKAVKLLLAKPEDAEKLLVRQEDEWRKR